MNTIPPRWLSVFAGWAALVPLAQAQREYSPHLRFSVLGGEGNIYLAADGIAAQANGTVYASDLYRGAIFKAQPGGNIETLGAFSLDASGERAPFSVLCWGIAVDGGGNTFAATQRSVFKISPEGRTTLLADDFGSAKGIAVDTNGNVYVAEGESHVIYKISPNGIRATLAGTLGERGDSDGTESARFNQPTGVAVDSAGNVYVADFGNKVIRKITSEGVVSTLAGLAGVPGGVDGVGSAARFQVHTVSPSTSSELFTLPMAVTEFAGSPRAES